ncbi:MAG: hypothetical protein LJE93_14515, partial [Acidobacteria bacterium]|nr:hypothetical protein [Acidobacteriota bacterium]
MLNFARALTVTVLTCAATTVAARECRVVLSDGAALSGARISVIGRGESLVADGDGRFELDPVPELP